MGTSRDGRIRKSVNIKGKNINARFTNQAEAMRVGLLVDYINLVMKTNPKSSFEDVSDLLLADFKKTLAFVSKIKQEIEDDG